MRALRLAACLLPAFMGVAPAIAQPPQVPRAPVVTPDERAAGWRADIDAALEGIIKNHKNAFHKRPREELQAAADALKARADTASDAELAVGLMQLCALVGDAHTAASMGSTKVPFGQMAFDARWFKDGLFVTATDVDHKPALAGRIVAVYDTPIDEVIAKIATTFAHENDAWLKQMSRQMLRTPEVLFALGIIPSPQGATLKLVMPDASERSVDFKALGRANILWFAAVGAIPLNMTMTMGSRPQERWYGSTSTSDDATLFVWYDRCADQPQHRTVAKFAEEVLKAIDTKRPQRIVIDLSRNTGGNSALLQPLIIGLAARRTQGTLPPVFVLIGRPTFSSGMLNAAELKNRAGAVLVGVPTGGTPNGFGEVKSFTLPYSQVQVSYSTKLFRRSDIDTPSLMPDLEVEPTWADYAAGKDVVMEAVLAYKPK